jgi:hypothetical protein
MRISIDSVIDNAKFLLGLRDTTYADADLERLIDEGARHLGRIGVFVISCETLDIDCAKAALPGELICFSFPDTTCTGCCNATFDPATESNPFNSCGCYQYYTANRSVLTEFCGMNVSCGLMGGFGYSEQGGYLVFPSNITATTVKVWTRGKETDDDGIMVLDDMDERGVAAYAAYKYASAGQNYKMYPQRKEWKDEWVNQKNMRIAQDFQSYAKQNANIWSAVCRSIILNPTNILNQNF